MFEEQGMLPFSTEVITREESPAMKHRTPLQIMAADSGLGSELQRPRVGSIVQSSTERVSPLRVRIPFYV